jgi:hypothetical protein
VELYESSRRESRRTWALALTLLVAIFIAGAPVVQAAVQAVRVTNTPNVKIKDTGDGRINSQAVPNLGVDALGVPGSTGAVDVRTFGGGGGLIAAGDCDGDDSDNRPSELTVAANPKTIITALIVTGDDADVAVSAPNLTPIIGAGPVANFRSTTAAPNAFIGLGNGLTVQPANLVFECTGVGGGPGSGNFVILGQ